MVARAGHPEVGQVGGPRLVEEHVARLQVPVHHASAMSFGESAPEGVGEPLDVDGRGRSVSSDPVRQRAPRQVGHDEGDLLAVLQDIQELHDVRVVEPGEHLGLPLDPLAGAGDLVGRSVEGEPLEGDLGAVRPSGQVDHSHAATAQLGHPLVAHVTKVTRADDASSSQVVGIVAAMTETEDVTTNSDDADAKAHEAVIDEALRLIDTGLSDLMHRELVSTDEVSDLLLDVRMLLTAAEMATGAGPLVEEPVGA